MATRTTAQTTENPKDKYFSFITKEKAKILLFSCFEGILLPYFLTQQIVFLTYFFFARKTRLFIPLQIWSFFENFLTKYAKDRAPSLIR